VVKDRQHSVSGRFLCNSGPYLPEYKCHIPKACYLETGNSSYRTLGSLCEVA